MKKFKKLVAVTLAATMLTSMSQMSLSAFAATVQSESVGAYEGSCGDNVQYELDISTGTLTISGTGAMTSYGSSYYNAPWRYYLNSIKTLVINDGVTSISGFGKCTNLVSVSIPESVTVIDYDAFYGCTKLTDVSIPNSVTTIGTMAFRDCSSLVNISIPESVTTIVEGLFWGCSNLANVSIPNSVTTIGEDAFRDCTSLKDITIPDSVTTIGEYAFDGCTSLTDIAIPDSVTDLERYAFQNCTGLETLKLPANIKEIKSYAFYNCNSLKSVNIPNGVECIESSAFENCRLISELTLPDTVKIIGNSAFIGTKLRRVFIPDTVLSLQYDSFGPSYGPATVLVSSIGSPAYWAGLDDQATFKFESTGKYYNTSGSCGDNAVFAFNAESGLITISGIGDMQDYDSYNWGSTSNTPWFSFRKGIKNVKIEEGITSIGYNSFIHCEYLETVYIPNSVTKISGIYIYSQNETFKIVSCEGGPAESFANENQLKFESTGEYFTASGKCGENITYNYDGKTKALVLSGTGATYDFERVEGNPDHYAYPWYSYTNCIESIVINEGITTVDVGSIDGVKIKTIDIPASLSKLIREGTEVEYFNEYNLESLKRFNVANGNPLFTDIDGVLFNADKTILMLYPKMHGENYVIPDGVVSINSGAFFNNKNIKSIVMPDTVTSSASFWGCTNLESVVLSKALTSIESFGQCESLKQIDIPNSVTSIDSSAFGGCKALQSVVIPEGVTSLKWRTFYECDSLRTLVIPASVTSIESGAISMKDRSILVIYGVPGSYAQTYAEANNITFRNINEQVEPSVAGYNVSLGGDIGLNYFVNLGYDSLNKDIKMTFVNEATGKEITSLGLYESSNAVIDGKLYYKFTCPVSASHMSDKIKPILTIDGVAYEFNVYSVKDYAEVILGDEKYASAAPVVKAMLNYGAYSEIALRGVTTSDTNSALTEEEKQLGEVENLESYKDYTFEPGDSLYSDYIKYAGSRISLKNETVIKHYFKIDESKVDMSKLYSTCNHKEVAIVKDGEYYRVDIKGISASKLYANFDIQFNCNDNYWTLYGYSVLTYINSALNSTTISDEVKDTVKALYFFYQATYNYSKNS